MSMVGVCAFVAWRGLSDEYRAAVNGHTPWRADTPNPDPICVADVFREPALASYESVFRTEGIRSLAQGMPRVAKDPRDLEGRSNCLYGAWLCGAVLGTTSMALHHKLCHLLGGTWNLPHAHGHFAACDGF